MSTCQKRDLSVQQTKDNASIISSSHSLFSKTWTASLLLHLETRTVPVLKHAKASSSSLTWTTNPVCECNVCVNLSYVCIYHVWKFIIFMNLLCVNLPCVWITDVFAFTMCLNLPCVNLICVWIECVCEFIICVHLPCVETCHVCECTLCEFTMFEFNVSEFTVLL